VELRRGLSYVVVARRVKLVIDDSPAAISDSHSVIGHSLPVIGHFRGVIRHSSTVISDFWEVIGDSPKVIGHSQKVIGDSSAAIVDSKALPCAISAVARHFEVIRVDCRRVPKPSRRDFRAASERSSARLSTCTVSLPVPRVPRSLDVVHVFSRGPRDEIRLLPTGQVAHFPSGSAGPAMSLGARARIPNTGRQGSTALPSCSCGIGASAPSTLAGLEFCPIAYLRPVLGERSESKGLFPALSVRASRRAHLLPSCLQAAEIHPVSAMRIDRNPIRRHSKSGRAI